MSSPFLAFDRQKMGLPWWANERMHQEFEIEVVGVQV